MTVSITCSCNQLYDRTWLARSWHISHICGSSHVLAHVHVQFLACKQQHAGSPQLHAQLLSEFAATVDHTAYAVKDMSGPRMPLTGTVQC